MPEATFQPDSHVVAVAEAYSLDAVDLAARNFGITLDWSEASVGQVEQMLGILHDKMSTALPPEEAIWTYAKAFGSYIGEVFRRHQGGEWGTISMDGASFPGLRQANGGLIWPWSKAHKRLTNGPEDNVWHYYSALIKGEFRAGAIPNPQGLPPNPAKGVAKRPWWKFW